MRFLLLLSCLLLAGPRAQAADDWPPRVVAIEDMRMATPMRIGVPRLRPKGEVRGPVVLRVHVDAQGAVRRVALLDSSGSPAHDEASMQAMRSARFVPKQIDGVPADVTLVVPLHLPKTRQPGGD